MYRSWAYILMVVATLAGVVALLWPGPPVRTVEEISMPARPAAPRPEPPAAAAKPPPKPAPARKPAPAVIDRMPRPDTTTGRAAPRLNNGLQPNIFGQPNEAGSMLGRGELRPGAAPQPSGELRARPLPAPPPIPAPGAAR